MRSFFDTKFWDWHFKHRASIYDITSELHAEALAIIVESVKEGDLTSLDGVESPTSRRIKEHFGVNHFEMNTLWIGSDQEWICPCCGRTKFQIARLGRSGQILAKLVVHHDHMGDAMKEAFHSAFVKSGTEVEQVDGLKLVERMGTAFAAFPNILVCEDCNQADVLATERIKFPPYFSFSVGQMKQFILSSNHSAHQVDFGAIDHIWSKAEPAYRLRMELIEKVAHASATDAHWYEPIPWSYDPIPTLQYSRFRMGDNEIKKWGSVEHLFHALGPQRRTGIRDYSKWRKKKSKSAAPLPANYLAMLRSEPTFARRWDELGVDWSCPVCARNKTEILYVGKQGKITLGLHTQGANGLWHNAECFCSNCLTVLLGLKHEVEAIVGIKLISSYEFVSPNELASVIIAKPHATHEVRSDAAQELLDSILERKGF